jgi:putative N6-adenine-specific DNA methylase
VADRFRAKSGVRPDVNTQWPDVRIYLHLTTDTATLYIDTSGEPLFKRGWREDKGDAPLKETLAAAMIAASGWGRRRRRACRCTTPAAAAAPWCHRGGADRLQHRAGPLRRFAFEKMLPFQPMCGTLSGRSTGRAARALAPMHLRQRRGHRMVDFASATPSARAWPMRCSCAAATPAAHAAVRHARRDAAQPAVWRAH